MQIDADLHMETTVQAWEQRFYPSRFLYLVPASESRFTELGDIEDPMNALSLFLDCDMMCVKHVVFDVTALYKHHPL